MSAGQFYTGVHANFNVGMDPVSSSTPYAQLVMSGVQEYGAQADTVDDGVSMSKVFPR